MRSPDIEKQKRVLGNIFKFVTGPSVIAGVTSSSMHEFVNNPAIDAVATKAAELSFIFFEGSFAVAFIYLLGSDLNHKYLSRRKRGRSFKRAS